MLTKKQKFLEQAAIAVCYTAILVLKIVALKTQAINTDEPQHLHVVWGWTAGFVQYRDIFDNHTPIFHMLFAPLLKAVQFFTGDTVAAFFAMRASMTILFFINGWLTFRLLEKVGVLSKFGCHLLTLIALTFPYSFIVSDEFRTDNLWVTAWLCVLLCLMNAITVFDYVLLGFMIATCALVSFKTLALLAGLGGSAAAVLAVDAPRLSAEQWRFGLRRGVALVSGVLTILTLFVITFALLGSFQPMLYGVIQHNLVPALGNWKHDSLKALFPLSVVAAYFLAQVQRSTPRIKIVQFHIVLTYCFFNSFWPLITPQDYLPLYPLLPFLVLSLFPNKRKMQALWWPIALAAIAVFLYVDLQKIDPSAHTADGMVDEMRAMLTMTAPDDYVMDEKGEALFRRRPFFYALERITLERFKRGTIQDTIPEQLVKTDTKVVRLYRVFPRTQEFVMKNYVPILRFTQVAGQKLDGALPHTFRIEIPADYVFLHDGALTHVTIDGTEVSGSISLSVGEHVLQRTEFPTVFLFWKKAYDSGFFPHDPTSVEYKRIEPFSR